MSDKIHLEFNVAGNNFASAGTATSHVKDTLKNLGIANGDIRRIAIAMYEAEINMVIHGGGGKVYVDIDTDKIEVLLVDQGKGIENIELAMQPGWSTASEDIRIMGFGAGMGLPNIKKYTDVFDISSEVGKGTKVYLRVNFG